MHKIKMSSEQELTPGRIIEKMILARRVAVLNDNGTIHGIQSECAHMRASLAQGGFADGILTCKWHGWRYRLDTGECLTTPGCKIKKYPVEVVDGDIYLLL